MGLLFPKDKKKSSDKKKRDRNKKRKELSENMRAEYGEKCMNYMVVEHTNIIDCCHILPKKPNSPWLDIPENCLLLCRKCHDKFDGRDNTPDGFKEYVVSNAAKVNSKYTYAYLYVSGGISKQKYEEHLKQIYYQRIGETK